MRLDLVQLLSLSDLAGSANDDRAGANSYCAWVIDGATDLGEAGLLGEIGGAAWLSSHANAAFHALSSDLALGDAVEFVFDRVAQNFIDQQVRAPVADWELPSAAFLAISIAHSSLKLAWLADCACLRIRKGKITRLGPRRNLAERKEAAQALGLGAALPWSKDGTTLTMDLRSQRQRSKRAVLGVDKRHYKNVEYASSDCRTGDEYILMTDGFAALIDQYEMSTTQFETNLRAQGLQSLAVDLRTIERADLNCTMYPRYKQSDDATALWLRAL